MIKVRDSFFWRYDNRFGYYSAKVQEHCLPA
jgi:hypothetical protein